MHCSHFHLVTNLSVITAHVYECQDAGTVLFERHMLQDSRPLLSILVNVLLAVSTFFSRKSYQAQALVRTDNSITLCGSRS